jgi:hypothetical protein
MHLVDIENIEYEVRRFLGACDDAKERLKKDKMLYFITGCRESGALRRASLDLTRALADLRK